VCVCPSRASQGLAREGVCALRVDGCVTWLFLIGLALPVIWYPCWVVCYGIVVVAGFITVSVSWREQPFLLLYFILCTATHPGELFSPVVV